MRRRVLRRIIEGYVEEAVEAGLASREDIERYVRTRIRRDFDGTKWLSILLQLVKMLLPVLVILLEADAEDPAQQEDA